MMHKPLRQDLLPQSELAARLQKHAQRPQPAPSVQQQQSYMHMQQLQQDYQNQSSQQQLLKMQAQRNTQPPRPRSSQRESQQIRPVPPPPQPPSNSRPSSQPPSSFMGRYRVISMIGQGAFGEVFKALDTRSNKLVAIKRMKPQHEYEGVPSVLIREVSLLKKMKNRYIVQLLDVGLEKNKFHLVFHYYEMDLRKYMHAHQPQFEPLQIKKFMQQLLRAVKYLHDSRIMHRDLKPANILVDTSEAGEPQLLLADMGMGRTYCLPMRPYSMEVVTLSYRAPELLFGAKTYGTGVDIWSIGCIFAELVLGHVIIRGDSEIDAIFRICRTFGLPSEENWRGLSECTTYQQIISQNQNMPNYEHGQLDLKEQLALKQLDNLGQDLFFQLMTYDPEKRISAKDALDHPYFYDLTKHA